MITAIQSIESLEAILRSVLLTQSALDGNHVLNALGIRGPAMEKPGTTQGEVIFESMTNDESILVFELYEKDEYSEDTIVNDVSKLFTYVELGLKLIVYGKSSRTLAQTIKARLLSQEVRDALFASGVNLQTISAIEPASEYINDVLWQRRDFEVSLSCYLNISKITNNDHFTNADTIEIIKIS